MLNTLVLVSSVLWVLYKFFHEKNLKYLLIAFVLSALILSQWPFFLSEKLPFAVWSFTAAGFMIYENYYKKGFKNSPPTTSIYILLFIGFGLLFLGEVWFSFHIALLHK
ncbi:MAG TPA: hypothetical protein PKW79_04590 [Rhabdochlamydiaceae bacterium]|jgi:hypothetical protein|nr:hypothetical protein [Rhabdochlamydiaceae bacterium]